MYNIEQEINMSTVIACKYEGYREEEYLCPAGIPTIGHGRNLEVFPLDPEELPYTKEDSIKWVKAHITEIRKDLMVWFPQAVELPQDARLILVDMAYNMGLKGLKGFPKMLEAMKDKDWATAAEELKDSKYYSQTGQRSQAHYRTLKGL